MEIRFRGRFDHQMDDKGRVSLPAAFRRDAASERFVLVPQESSHLRLFPEEVWTPMESELLELARVGTEEEEKWVRGIFFDLEPVSPDRQGRILIPGALKDRAGLANQVTLLGMGKRIELWPPDDLRTSVVSPATETADLKRTRRRIMG